MEVQFRRTGERRYALRILRENLPPLEFGGPGYDPLMPHDLQHFIVESELGLANGIFGFIAAGGQTGWPDHVAAGEDHRTAARRRAKGGRRDRKMLRRGERAGGDTSERAAGICWYEWLRRSPNPERRQQAASMALWGKDAVAGLPEGERKALTEDVINCICARMDELSARWVRLRVGESFSVEWKVAVPGRRVRRRGSATRPRTGQSRP